ncbi:MAG TPA: hypothetical protein VLT36_09150 [Candidatus Dormibacteraeota bacterium]|nr:hypothetical protein [Candidatus Dormibacteraeota bacterium]
MKVLTSPLLACGLLCAAGSVIAQNNPFVKMIGIPDATPETNPPAVFIDYPTNGHQVSQSNIQTLITARDDTRVESFRFSLNGTPGIWYWAPGMQQPWGTSIQLNPGTNIFAVECGDYWGNMATASVTFDYAPDSVPASDPAGKTASTPTTIQSDSGSGLKLDVGTGGQVRPNLKGQILQVGTAYSITAQPQKGFRFDGWSGSIWSRRPKLTFVMSTNLSFTARFRDISRPVNIVTFPRMNRTLSNSAVIATGKAADNSALTNLYYQLNGGGWTTALTTNAWRNWETSVLSPIPGHNVLESYAVDDSGLPSRTNRVRFHY